MKKYLVLLPLLAVLFISFSKPTAHKPRKGKDYALLFAVQTYDDPKLNTLKYPIENAKDIKTELETNYDFEVELVTNPTKRQIRNKLNEYETKFANGTFNKEGQLFLFFTGHGEKESSNSFFLPKDAKTDDLESTAFSYDLWRKNIDGMSCKHILVAIDACKSGLFDPESNKGDIFGLTRPGELTEREKLILKTAELKTRLFVSSGISDASTPDKSAFAYQFLNALRSKGNSQQASDNVLTINELNTFLELATPKTGGGKFGENQAGSSFLFISNELATKAQPTTDEKTSSLIPPIYINFDLNQENIKEKEAIRLGTHINKHPGQAWVFTGSSSVNDTLLAFNRAKNIIDTLVSKLGIDRSRLILMYEKYQDNVLYGFDRVEIRVASTMDKEMSAPISGKKMKKAKVSMLEIGYTYLTSNELDKAEEAFNNVVTNYKGKPEVVPALLKLGFIAEKKGNNEKAISYYREVIYNNPNNTDAKTALERLQDIYVNNLGKRDEYLAFLKTIPGYNPGSKFEHKIPDPTTVIAYWRPPSSNIAVPNQAEYKTKKRQPTSITDGGGTGNQSNLEQPKGQSQGKGMPDGASGFGGRPQKTPPRLQENFQKSGRVVLSVCIDSDGLVIEAKYNALDSTTNDEELVDAAIRNARQYRFKPSSTNKRCGKITHNFIVR